MNNKCPCPSSIYVIGNTSSNIGPTGPTGPRGDDGITPTLEIGEVITGVPGSPAMVFIRPINSMQITNR